MRNLHLKLLALALVVFAVTLASYKVFKLGLPLVPSEGVEIWSVEARFAFRGKGGPIKARLRLPNNPPGFLIVDENFVSGRYGLTIQEEKDNRVAEWVVRRAKGEEVLYYHLQLAHEAAREEGTPNKASRQPSPSHPLPPPVPVYAPDVAPAVTALLEEVRQKSADVATFTRELLLRVNAESTSENVQMLMQNVSTPTEKVAKIRWILAGARIPTRPIQVLALREGERHGEPIPWFQAHNGQRWVTFNPDTSESGIPANVLVWAAGEAPLAEVEGGRHPKVEFAATRYTQEALTIAERRARKVGSRVMEFSLFSLPIQTQNVYRIILMIPIGALLIAILRNVVGIKTFGTFMPILIALAFRETELVWGVLLFTLVVTLGLAFRFYLEYLQLLLVPRLASVLIIVILLMAVITMLSHKLGLERGLSVALFPMVILTMTVERMALIWEEHGPGEALQQGVGSMIVAILAFLLMSNGALKHMIFVFPELLLVVLAATLLLGRYAGYRLTELWRFRAFLKDSK
ncbi:MAG: inactive transglutaminase family protein [Methylohalobius crimeensis]